jgi:hypothetical protein
MSETTPDVPSEDEDVQEPEAPQEITCSGSASLPAPGGDS